MKFIVFLLLIFFTLGCVETWPYKDIPPSELVSNPKAFEGKKVCIIGTLENNSISGILLEKNQNFSGEYTVCGTFKDGKLEIDYMIPVFPTYPDVSPSELMSNPKLFEGQKLCVNGIFENNTISGVLLGKLQNLSAYKNWTLATVCGAFNEGVLDADYANSILSISTEKDIYSSNETLNVHMDFISKKNGQAQVLVSGIKNEFGRALISETRDVTVEAGTNGFDFEFATPSCEECAALSPGVYTLRASVKVDAETFETYKKITLEREE